MKSSWVDIVYWIGCVLISAGAYLVYVPAALVVLGVGCLFYARMGAIAAIKVSKDERSR